jgi:hypothetical protein
MPSSHRRYADWTPERLRRQDGEIGRNTSALVEIILRERTHPEQGFRACIGILRLVKTYCRERLEDACSRALEIGAHSYSSVNSIQKNNLDRPAKLADGPAIAQLRAHDPAKLASPKANHVKDPGAFNQITRRKPTRIRQKTVQPFKTSLLNPNRRSSLLSRQKVD